VRRPTLIVIIVLFALLIAAGIFQLVLATKDSPPLQGPVSPGQLPSFSPSPAS
jgi:hypothetical protein